MAESVKLEIVTPERLFYIGEIELVIVRTLTGDEGFMARHSWACKLLDVGEIWIQEKGAAHDDFKVAATAGGFIDVKNTITIFTDAAEWPDEIDVERSQLRKEKAEDYLKNKASHSADEILYNQVSLSKAITRMQVAQGGSRKKKKD